MGHLDNSERVIEARLTALGRQRLAEGGGLDVTQFALSDDEVDYQLWQQNLPDEDAGAIIENLPTFEAFTDEQQSMRYKLITLERNSNRIPQLNVPSDLSSIRIEETSSTLTIPPSTQIDGDDTKLDETLGYTAIFQDEDLVDLVSTEAPEEPNATIPALYGEEEGAGDPGTIAVVGTEFELDWNAPSITSDTQSTLTIIGNETGLSIDIDVNVIAS